MALATFLKPIWALPYSIQFGGEGPRKVHWVGGTKPVEQNQSDGGNRNAPQKKKEDRGYRDLSTIKLGEVDEIFRLFSNYLEPSSLPGWVAPNYFCMIPLRPDADGRPSAVFGRVRTCFPGDGYAEDLRELEMFYPNNGGDADLLHLWREEMQISSRVPFQSFCLRVKLFLAEDEIAEHADMQNQFTQSGFEAEFSDDFLELLQLDEKRKASQPRLFVVSSRWFEGIPDSIRPDVRESLAKLIRWNRTIFNFHSNRLPLDFATLNHAFGFKHGFTDVSFFEPSTPQETLDIVTREFDRIFQQGMA